MPRIHIHLHSGHVYESDVPEGFRLDMQIAAIKANGHFCDLSVFIPYESIDFVYMMSNGQAPIANPVSGMTRQ